MLYWNEQCCSITNGVCFGFTARYNLWKLIYYESVELITEAIKRGRFIKGKSRKWKEGLFEI